MCYCAPSTTWECKRCADALRNSTYAAPCTYWGPGAHVCAGRPGAGDARASLDSVWLRLQQQHTLESEAASLGPAAGSAGAPTPGGPSVPAMQGASEAARLRPAREAAAALAPVAPPLPPPPAQGMSEADFWKQLGGS